MNMLRSGVINSLLFVLLLSALLSCKARESKLQSGEELIGSTKFYPLGNERRLVFDGEVNSVAFSKDGRYLATGSWDETARVLELSTLKTIAEIKHSELVYSVAFSPDGRYLATGSDDYTARVTELSTLKTIAEIKHSDRVHSVAFSPAGRYLATGSDDKTARVTELSTLKNTAEIKHSNWVYSVAFSPAGRYLATGSIDHTARVTEISTLKAIAEIKHPNSVYSVAFSPDGRYLATGSWDETARVTEISTLKTIAEIKHSDLVHSVAFSPDGRYLATGSNDNTARVTEISTLKTIAEIKHSYWVKSVAFSPDGRYLATGSGDKTARIIEDPLSALEITPTPPQSLSYNPQELCADLDLEKSATIYVNLLRSKDWVSQNKPQARALLESILIKSNMLFREVNADFNHLAELLAEDLTSPSCLSASQEKAVQAAAQQYLKDTLNWIANERADWAHFAGLMVLRRHYQSLSKKEKETGIDQIATALSYGAADTPEASSIFLSKLYKLAKQTARRIYSVPEVAVTDLVLKRHEKRFDVIAVGSRAINDQPLTPHHMGLVKVAEIPLPSNPTPGPMDLKDQANIRWRHAGQDYEASIKLTVGSEADSVEVSDAPPYDRFYSNGMMAGAVIAGSNLSSADQLMRYYQQYFTGLGFVFAKAASAEVSTKDHFFSEIRSGRLDYFIKEAHSDGDDKNLFRVFKKSTVQRGTRQNQDGTMTQIDIYFGRADSSTELLSNSEFASALRARSETDRFLYFNTSCWSKNKALQEIQAAGKRLIEIPSLTVVQTLSTQNALGKMFEAFISRATYEGMREAMIADENFKNKSKNHFIFPDEDDYRKHIISIIKYPIEENIVVRSLATQQVMNIDELEPSEVTTPKPRG